MRRYCKIDHSNRKFEILQFISSDAYGDCAILRNIENNELQRNHISDIKIIDTPEGESKAVLVDWD